MCKRLYSTTINQIILCHIRHLPHPGKIGDRGRLCVIVDIRQHVQRPCDFSLNVWKMIWLALTSIRLHHTNTIFLWGGGRCTRTGNQISYLFFFKWQEITQDVWCCPIKLKSAISAAPTKTILVGNLLLAFYSKEELTGKRLHELDQKIIDAIIGIYHWI